VINITKKCYRLQVQLNIASFVPHISPLVSINIYLAIYFIAKP